MIGQAPILDFTRFSPDFSGGIYSQESVREKAVDNYLVSDYITVGSQAVAGKRAHQATDFLRDRQRLPSMTGSNPGSDICAPGSPSPWGMANSGG